MTSLVVAAGAGVRLPGDLPKGVRPLAGKPLYLHSLLVLDRVRTVDGHVLVLPADRASAPVEAWGGVVKPVHVVAGGRRRQDSVLAGLELAAKLGSSIPNAHVRYVAVHDAARPLVDLDLIERTIAAARSAGAAIPVVVASDTVREVPKGGGRPAPVDRSRLRLAQTPQVARLDWLLEAYRRAGAESSEVTDEGSALEQAGFDVALVEGSPLNFKVTTPPEFAAAEAIIAARPGTASFRIGLGEDRHPRSRQRPFTLAGVVVSEEGGPAGHSDGDLLCHALVDALLGAAGEGTIGDHFPDTDERWSRARGLDLLQLTFNRVCGRGWRPVNVDAVIIADTPHLQPYVSEIRNRLATVLGIGVECVSVKGKRAEGLGFEGSGSGLSCRCVVLLERAASS